MAFGRIAAGIATGGQSEFANALLGGGLFGGGGGGGGIDINAELNRINALYEQARTQGQAAITQDYQAQRGELAQSQAARGILRSGVSSLGQQRLGAARQQAIAAFNAQLLGAQAGQQSSLLNALLGRKTALDESERARRQQTQGQLLGLAGGALGAYLGGPLGAGVGQKVAQGGYNFFGSNMVSPTGAGAGLTANPRDLNYGGVPYYVSSAPQSRFFEVDR